MTTQTTPNSNEHYETIQIGIDPHAQRYHVSPQVDGATPQAVQKLIEPEGQTTTFLNEQRLEIRIQECLASRSRRHEGGAKFGPTMFDAKDAAFLATIGCTCFKIRTVCRRSLRHLWS